MIYLNHNSQKQKGYINNMDNPVSYIILTFILIYSFYYVFNMAQKEKEERRIESEEFWFEYDRNLKNVKNREHS